MIDLPTTNALSAILDEPLSKDLRPLLRGCLLDTLKCGLQDFTHVLVVEAGDTGQEIEAAVGFNPLRSRIDKLRNSADWDWIERHHGWWELLYTVGNEGFAFILLVEDSDESALALLCRSKVQK